MTSPPAARLCGVYDFAAKHASAASQDATPTTKELMRQKFADARGHSPRFRRRPGFSMIEMVLVLIVVGLLVRITVVKTSRIMRHERVNRAAQVMVQDLQNGFAMAGRQRAPVRLTFTPSTKTYVFSDRASGTVYQTRVMDSRTEFQLSTMTPSVNTIDVLPNGIGSTAFNVVVGLGDYSKKVTASSAGFIRSN
ncbi:MAG TPA: prepilin-type N-terminal cleavage/methylation domain-containing protein [Gemmatimonadaceae bacterium]|nr:prepilin-type N-terminal cleavage/methylation domain-containing protein [Gemmatimonadaceae bacterium]